MIISLCGDAGSGKSTVAGLLAKKLGFRRYSVGGYRRQRAQESGLTLEQYNKKGESDPSTDKEADQWTENLGKTEDNFIIDSRLSFLFIPHSFKVYLTARPSEAARRIFNDRRPGESFNTVEEAQAAILRRRTSDILRYKKYYHLNPFDPKHYDCIIDTTEIPAEKVAEQILAGIKRRQPASAVLNTKAK